MGAPNASARGVAFVRGLGGGAHRCGGWCSGRRCAQIRVVRCAGVWWNARVCCSPPILYDAGPCATDAARVESSGRRAHAVGRRRPAVWHARGLAMGKPWHELAVEKHGHGEGKRWRQPAELCHGIVDYSRPVTIRNLRQDLAREWADWHDAALRAATIDKLAKKYRSGLVYRIKNRMLFDEPVAVRVTRRNYGDGWVRAEHVELRNAVSLPAWTRVPQPIRRAMARARCSEQ